MDDSTGVAWLSSARVVGCSLQWGNERNPCQILNIYLGLLEFISGGSEDDVRSAWPLWLGLHTCYNEIDNGFAKSQDGANPNKLSLSGDWGLQFAPMNVELVVIAHQLWRGEYVLGSCTK